MKPQILIQQAGVYQIRNLVNEKKYIGSSVNIQERFTDHKRKLSLGKHANRHLQAAWNLYGTDSFVFEIVRLCERECILVEEQAAIEQAMPTLYNISTKAGAPMAGRKHTEEAKLRIGEAQKGNTHSRGRVDSVETRLRKRLVALGQPHPRPAAFGKPHPHKKGYRHSDATRERMRLKYLAREKPDYCGEKNPFYGKKHSEEVRAKMSAAKKGVPWTEARRAASRSLSNV